MQMPWNGREEGVQESQYVPFVCDLSDLTGDIESPLHACLHVHSCLPTKSHARAHAFILLCSVCFSCYITLERGRTAPLADCGWSLRSSHTHWLIFRNKRWAQYANVVMQVFIENCGLQSLASLTFIWEFSRKDRQTFTYKYSFKHKAWNLPESDCLTNLWPLHNH